MIEEEAAEDTAAAEEDEGTELTICPSVFDSMLFGTHRVGAGT